MQNSPNFYRDDLEDRLVDYTRRMIDVVEALPGTRSGNYIAGQINDCKNERVESIKKLNPFIERLSKIFQIAPSRLCEKKLHAKARRRNFWTLIFQQLFYI